MLKHGILMTPDNAQKTHDGLKTQTRRVMSYRPVSTPKKVVGLNKIDGQIYERWEDDAKIFSPRYHPGDIVSIKEHFWRWGYKKRNKKGNWVFLPDYFEPVADSIPEVIFSSPDDKPKTPEAVGYHSISGFFLPYDLARTHAEILDARPERLQDITEGDAIAEGVTITEGQISVAALFVECRPDLPRLAPSQQAFSELWDSINAKRGHLWANNDWIWRYEYERKEL